jgi:hypothetical protein
MAILVGVGLLTGPMAASQAASTPVSVIATPADDYRPAASSDYIAWVEWTGRKNIAYAQARSGGPIVRVNAPGTQGFVGSIVGTTVVYQQYDFESGESDIYSFDLVTHDRVKIVVPGRNRWEYSPSQSGDWLMFGRYFSSGNRRLYITDLVSHEMRLLAETDKPDRALTPGQVNGNYAVFGRSFWGKHSASCDVFLYDISAEATAKIANPGPKCQFGPSVDPSGTVFFGRSGFGCGKNVSLRQLPVGGSVSTLVSFPEGRDFYYSYALDNLDGTTDVFYDPLRCRHPANIVKITAP